MSKVWNGFLKFLKGQPIFVGATVAAIVTAFFVPPDKEYISYINWRTIAGLASIFIAIKGLERTRFFKLMSVKILSYVSSSRALILCLVFIPTFLSFFITNDVAVVIFVPFSIIILTMCGMQKLLLKTVVLICIGTSMTGLLSPIANAQNIYLFAYYNLSFGYMFQYGWLTAIAGFGLLFLCCFLTKNENVATFAKSDIKLKERKFPQFVILFVLSVMSIIIKSNWFYWAVLAVVLVTALITDYKSVKRVRYMVLLTYIMFFIFAGNLKRIPAVGEAISGILAGREYFLSIGLSELISNTPASIIVSQFSNAVLPIMLGMNIGKIGTIHASMMSIVAMAQYMNYDDRPGKFLKSFTLYSLLFLAVLTAFGVLTLWMYNSL